MRIINASETGTLVLGFQGEDQRLEIRFPLVDEKTGRNITEEFPGGSFSISIMLPGDPAEHIVGSEDFRIEGNWLIWTVKEAYTVGFGEGKLQLNYAFGGMAKSRIWKTNVRKSINSGSGTVPSWSDWKTELLNAAAAVESAVDSYDEMTAEAEELPAGSTPTAEMDHTGDHPVLKLGIPASQGGGGGDVQSVNGKTGVVVLNANDVGALPSSTPIPPAVTVDSALSGTSTNPVQNKVIKAKLDEQSETIVNLSTAVSGKYAKPSGGIPSTDLSQAVQTSLGKADSAIQTHQDISGKQNKPSAAGTAGQVLGLDNSLNPVWITPSGGGGSDLPITTPEEYGAKGDGVTDDTEAIQDAIDAGKYILFDGSKTYKITETIELHSDMVLDFNGCGIISTANISFSAYSDFDVTLYTGAYTANTVHSYSTGTGLINVQSDEQVHMGRDYYLGGMVCHSNNGHLNNSLPYSLEDCVIKGQSEPMRNIVIRNLGSYSNNIYGNWSYSFRMNGAEDVLIEHCNLMPNEQNYVGIGVHKSSNVTIRDCVIVMDDTNNDNTYGVEVNASSFVTVENCRIHSEKWHCITTGAGVTTLNTSVINCILSIANGVVTSSAYSDHGNTMRTFISGCKITGGLAIADGSVTDCEFVKRKDSYDYINISYRPWLGDYVPNFEFNNLRCQSKIFFSDTPDTQDMEEEATARIGRVHIANILGTGNSVTASDSINANITAFSFEELSLENYKGPIARIQVFKKLSATNCVFSNFEYTPSGYDSLIDYNPELNMSGCVTNYVLNEAFAIVFKAENTTFTGTVMGYGSVLPDIVLLNNCMVWGTSESGNTAKAQTLWQMANCTFNCRSTPVEKNTGIVRGTNLTTLTTGYAGAFACEIFKGNSASTYWMKNNPTESWSEVAIS